MSQQNERLLQKLAEAIESLAELVKQYSHIKHEQPCFSEQLFPLSYHKKHYADYFTEIENNFSKLANLTHKPVNTDYLQQINYITELMVNQIDALQRELATYRLTTPAKIVDDETIYEKHAKNLEYLRRLEEMKYELEHVDSNFNQQQLETLKQRIARCKHAISLLEQQMD